MLNNHIPETRLILSETTALTGKGFRFISVEKLNAHARLKIARKAMNILINRGKALAALLDAVPEDTFAGDLKKIAAWTDYLGLNGWFDWIDFEKVPEGYEDQV